MLVCLLFPRSCRPEPEDRRNFSETPKTREYATILFKSFPTKTKAAIQPVAYTFSNICAMYRSTCPFGPSIARQARSLSTKPGRDSVVAVLFQDIGSPIIGGVQKPRKPGGE